MTQSVRWHADTPPTHRCTLCNRDFHSLETAVGHVTAQGRAAASNAPAHRTQDRNHRATGVLIQSSCGFHLVTNAIAPRTGLFAKG